METLKCLSEWHDDALPEFVTFEADEHKAGMVFWDLHLTNYPTICGRTCSKKRAMARQALVMAAKGAVVYTLAPHQALVRQGRVSEGQAARRYPHIMDPIPWDRRAPSVDGLGRELIVQ